MNRHIRIMAVVGMLLVLIITALPAAAEFTIFEPGDGRVSAPFPLNAAPPRPVLTSPETIPNDLTEGAYLLVNTDNLNVRQGDSPEFAPVAVVDGGTSLIPLGWNGNTNDPWWYVQVGGVRGWVRGALVILRGDARSLPVVTARGTLTIPRLYVGWVGYLLNTPVPGAASVCEIGGNLEYEVIGRTADTSWYELRVNCSGAWVEGWLPAEYGIFRNPAGLDVPVTWFR